MERQTDARLTGVDLKQQTNARSVGAWIWTGK